MVFDKMSLILVDFTARLPDGTVIDTTRPKDYPAGEQRPANPEPRLVSLGFPSFPVVKGFEAALTAAEVNVPQSVDVEPADAYGTWERSRVRMITARKLEDPEKSSVGDEITINNRTGVIKFIGSGRIQVDYNHKYAGKTVRYDFTVVELLESDDAKVRALLNASDMLEDSDYTASDFDDDESEDEQEDFNYDMDDGILEVDVPEKMISNDRLQAILYRLQMDLFRFVPTLKEVHFVESFSAPTPAQEQAERAAP